jgi:hypothetical protein
VRRQEAASPAGAANPPAAENTVDRVGDATSDVREGTVDFGLFELFIDLLWWIRR